MSEDSGGGRGWFRGLDTDDQPGARNAIETGGTESPEAWPERAVEAGAVDSREAYYDWLHEATVSASRAAAADRERADDEQLIHAVRGMDDAARLANELAERVAEWAGAWYDESAGGLDYAREVAERDPSDPTAARVVALASTAAALDDEAADLRAYVERQAPAVAPNLAALAGPVLAARLIALVGGLGDLAKLPSGTVQVLGAEDALFAHLRGDAPSPKHGVIYTHDAVRGTRPADRGSAARAVAGKLSIAARIDHYSGDRRPALERELDNRVATIQARANPEADEADSAEDEP